MKYYPFGRISNARHRQLYALCQIWGTMPETLTEDCRAKIEEALNTIPPDLHRAVKEAVTTSITVEGAAMKHHISSRTLGRWIHRFYLALDRLSR